VSGCWLQGHLVQKLLSGHAHTHWTSCSTRTTKVVGNDVLFDCASVHCFKSVACHFSSDSWPKWRTTKCLVIKLFFLIISAKKTLARICMKFSGKVGNGPMNKWLNFSDDLDDRLEWLMDINLLLILIRQMAALISRALAEVCTVSVLLVLLELHNSNVHST